MAAKTIAKLTSNPTIQEVLGFLATTDSFSDLEVYASAPAEKFPNGVVFEANASVGVTYTHSDGRKEPRAISIFEEVCDKSESSSVGPFLEEPHTYISLGKTGRSEEILTLIAEQFGGFLIPDDEKEDEFVTINGTLDYALSPIAQELFDSLEGMTPKEKYKFVKRVEENKDKIEAYLGAMAV